MIPSARSTLRLSLLAAAVGMALVAEAQVRYTFSGRSDLPAIGFPNFNVVDQSFTLTVADFVDTTNGRVTFQAAAFDAIATSGPFAIGGAPATPLRASFRTTGNSIPSNLLVFTQSDATTSYSFPVLSIKTPGIYQTLPGNGNTGTLRVEVVPEPATMAALGLGTVSLIRRRKRA